MRYLFFFLSISSYSHAQINCNVYTLKNDSACYKACVEANEAAEFQGTGYSQQKFDKAIALCPTMAYAYFEKAVPYLKNGDFITWKKLIDKAVELDPMAHLGYRGWCRFQFVRDYQGAISDLEKLDALTRFDIGYSINGDYHLQIARALCYKALGEKTKAIEIIETQLKQKDYSPMPFDYLHLGVLKLETDDLKGAIEFLKKEIVLNDYLAENHYYLGLTYKKLNQFDDFKRSMEQAKAFYLKGYKRTDGYTHPVDKIFLVDIERELALTKK